MNDDRIRESKYAIPEANSNLKESIIYEYDNLSRAKAYKNAVTKRIDYLYQHYHASYLH